ncbi:MAG: hypothetical protein JZU52_10695 [Lamprocystis purpurea]|nr:hypothetical protein [Lamprocystis purpurea]
MQGAYNRGRYEQQMAAVAAFPWFLYDAVNDSRTRPAHSAMDGKTWDPLRPCSASTPTACRVTCHTG